MPPLVPGYRLLSRAEAPGWLYPTIARNGARVEQRLRECSLYRPELDLMVVAPDGQAAGCWSARTRLPESGWSSR